MVQPLVNYLAMSIPHITIFLVIKISIKMINWKISTKILSTALLMQIVDVS